MQRTLSVLLFVFGLVVPLNADDAIPARTLADIKGATAFIKMKAGPLRATGSGFLIQTDGKTGYIVTNHHVVVPGIPGFPKAEELTVVFYSGTKQEIACRAELLASDADRDLAVLRVTDVKQMPVPLDLRQKVELIETLPVFMFGFPFGQALSLTRDNPAMTVGKGTISSIRLNEREEVGRVQIDGDLNPGNSGGPVVDGKGRLVGVAVARIRGTRIGLAIPPGELTRMLNGRVAAFGTKTTRVNETTSDVEINVGLIDPLSKIKEVEVHYRLARDLKEKPRADRDTLWTLMAGAEKAKLTLAGQKATGKVRLKVKEKGLVGFAFQVACITGDGKKLITSLTPVDVDFGEVSVVGKPPMGEKPPPVVFLKDKMVQALPAIGDAIVAGGGRWLIVHLAEKRKALVWDVYQSRMAKELSLGSGHVKLAAGMDKLIVVLPDQKLIQRWSLKTFEREATAPLRIKGKVTGAAMGSASSGPLCLAVIGDNSDTELPHFFNPQTLRSAELGWEGQKPGVTGAFLRASANGQVFVARQGVGGEPHQCAVMVVQGRKVKVSGFGKGGSLLLPTPNGKLICTESGVYETEKFTEFGPRDARPTLASPFLPAQQGRYYLRLEQGAKDAGKLSIYFPGQEKPLGVLEEIEGHVGQVIAYGRLPNPMMHDKRVFFMPEAKMLITIPQSNDRLVMRSIDIDGLLAKATFDFLFVVSEPATVGRASVLYTYQVSAKSNKGGIKYKLESGPKGMKLSPQGLLEWEVPKKVDRTEHEVVIAVTDAAGQEVFQSFTITIE